MEFISRWHAIEIASMATLGSELVLDIYLNRTTKLFIVADVKITRKPNPDEILLSRYKKGYPVNESLINCL
jgi:hypothetical protein